MVPGIPRRTNNGLLEKVEEVCVCGVCEGGGLPGDWRRHAGAPLWRYSQTRPTLGTSLLLTQHNETDGKRNGAVCGAASEGKNTSTTPNPAYIDLSSEVRAPG